ncbi:hypothetical protein ACJJID_07170 [Microbulbifer sp. CnH-101-G]|uniref:hypothetical protein n=1 Tax=Microbulbifer sp. CnH-101-G TaxID=3243393 RepID=UPI00403A059B
MILGQVALWLNLLTIAALGLFVGILLVSAACLSASRHSLRLSASSRRLLLWSAVLLPWFAASTAAVILAFPSLLGGAASLAHWHHINAFNLYSWHGVFTIAFLVLTGFLVFQSFKRVHRHLAQLRLLMQLCERDKSDQSIIQAQGPQAFTSGLLRPQGFYTSGLRDQLTAEEFEVVRLHEEAHAQKFDPLKKLIFALFASFFPTRLGNYLNRQMALCMEQRADAYAHRQGWSETFIAQTLLKVTRISNGLQPKERSSALVCYFALDQLDARIRYLLSDNKGRNLSPLLLAGLFVVLTGTCLVTVDALHHTIETLFSH